MGSGAGVMEAVPGRIKQLFNDGEGGDGRDGGSGQSVVAGEMTGEAGTRRLERLEQLFTDGWSGRKRFLPMAGTAGAAFYRLRERPEALSADDVAAEQLSAVGARFSFWNGSRKICER